MAQVIVPGKKESALEKIARGLQIAGSVYGIAQANERLSLLAKQQEVADTQQALADIQLKEAKAASEGIVTPAKQMSLTQSGALFSPEPKEGFREFGKSPEGAPVFMQTPQDRQAIIAEQAAKIDKDKEDQAALVDAKIDFATKDKKINAAVDAYEAANQVKKFLQAKEPVVDAIALRNVFRMSGDVGAIRAEDLQQLGASPALPDQVLATYKRLAEGERILPNERIALAKAADVIQQVKLEAARKQASFISDALAKKTGQTQQEIFQFIDPDSIFPEPIDFTMPGNIGNVSSSGGILPKAQAAPQQSDKDAFDQFLMQELNR